MTYHNPMIPGFYSDPSIIRVGEDYYLAQGNNDYEQIQEVSARYLSSETIGGFTGTYIGLYATGNGKPSGAGADYDWFEYSDNRVDPSSHLF